MLRRSFLVAPVVCCLGPAFAGGPVPVVASFSVLADMVRVIGGDQLSVASLVAIGGDVHEYEPKPSDLAKIGDASVIVVNGLGLDRWMNRLIEASGSTAPVIVASAKVTPRQLPGGITDPHAWQDPRNGILYAQAIAAGFAGRVLASRLASYVASLEALDHWCAAQFAAIPPARRQIVTSHDAFGYYAARYGLTIHPVRGVENAEPSAEEFAALVTRLQQAKGSVVFLENMTNPALLQSLAEETGAKIGGSLYADSLSPPNGPAASYIAMIRYNTNTIVAALR